jgi:hypothetical protein
MILSGSRLAFLIVAIVLLTLFIAFTITSVIMGLMGDWEDHSDGLELTLKIMWGAWLTALAASFLTYVTAFGWRFRKLRPGEGPAALWRDLAADIKPSSWFKSGATSFTVTVILVSLFGAAFLASVLVWIIGDWNESKSIAMKAIWGSWWVLCIGTVLVRVALFTKQRRLARQAREEAAKKNESQSTPATEQSS